MLVEETNELIRNCIVQLIESGWLKTHIGKVLLGPNGQAHLNHFLKDEDNQLPNDFGIKPLQRIASVIKYEAHVVFVKQDDVSNIHNCTTLNHQFIQELSTQLVEYLSKGTQNITPAKGNKSQIDDVLDEVLNFKN